MGALHRFPPRLRVVSTDADQRLSDLIDTQNATLNRAAVATNSPTIHAEIDGLRCRINRWAGSQLNPDTGLGLLGPNGLQPQVEAVERAAIRQGFSETGKRTFEAWCEQGIIKPHILASVTADLPGGRWNSDAVHAAHDDMSREMEADRG